MLAPYKRSYGGTHKKEAVRPKRKYVVRTFVCLTEKKTRTLCFFDYASAEELTLQTYR